MKPNRTLWRIPAFGIVAGLLWHFLNRYFLGSLSLVTLPDGTVTMDPFRSLLMSGLILVVTIAYCALWVTPKMTRREAAKSAALLSGFLLLSVGIQALLWHSGSPAAAMGSLYLAQPFEWCGLLHQLVMLFGGSQWAGMLLDCLAPFLFVPFAKKELPDYREE